MAIDGPHHMPWFHLSMVVRIVVLFLHRHHHHLSLAELQVKGRHGRFSDCFGFLHQIRKFKTHTHMLFGLFHLVHDKGQFLVPATHAIDRVHMHAHENTLLFRLPLWCCLCHHRRVVGGVTLIQEQCGEQGLGCDESMVMNGDEW